MVKHTKGFKGLSKKVLSAILAASMIMTSSSFVMAAEPTEEPEVAVESVAEDATIEEVAEEDEAEDETVVEEENEAENEEVSVPETKVAAAPANNSAATGKVNVADTIDQIYVNIDGQDILLSDTVKDFKIKGSYEYEAGNPIEPELTMTDLTIGMGKVLNKGTDYDLTYENNTVVSSTTTEYAKMIVTFRGAYGDFGTYTFNYEIVPREIKEENATVYYATEEAFKYTGEVQYPVIERVVVRDGDETYELGEGDYEIVAGRNTDGRLTDHTSVDKHAIYVRGTGNYSGIIDSVYNYTITPAELSNSTCVVSVDPIAYLENLTAEKVKTRIEDSIVVHDGVNDRELAKLPEKEYTIKYMDEKTGEYTKDKPSVDMGVHQMRVYGAVNYDSDSYVDATYEIVKENSLQMAVNDALKNYQIIAAGYTLGSPGAIFTYNGEDWFIDNDEVKIKTLNKSQYTITTKRADWTNVGTYYITVEGKNNFAGDTATIPVYIQSKALVGAGFDYTATQGTHRSGAEGSVEVTVRDTDVNGGVTLTEGVDYVYSVEKRTWGVKYVHITGIGNYAGTIDKDIIVDTDKLYLSDESITAEVTKSYVYTGKPVEPTESDIKLVEKDINNEYEITDDDFRVVGYRNNRDAGEATVIIEAKDDSKNYVGRREITFTIGGLDFADTFEFAPIADVEIGSKWTDVLDEIEVEYQSNGATYASWNASWNNPQKRCEFEILKDGKRVTDTNDNDLAQKITEAGEYVVKATPVGNRYAGTLETTFTVKGVDVAQNTKVADIADQVYTGEAIKPEVTVTNDNMTLVEGKDYTVSYSGNVEGGTAVAIIKGIGNYSGTIEKEFTITQGQQELSMTNPLQERDLENGSRTTKSKVCTLKLGYALEDKNMSLSYDTSDASVATVNDGKITYKGVGECTITVTAKETNNCKADTLEIKVVVGKPGQPTFTPSVTSKTAKKSFVVTSSTIPGADGFEVQYSIRPDWWRATTKDFTNVSAGGKLYRQVLTTYHSNKTYYIRVRAYQVVDGEKVYSDWSPAKTATTK